MIGSFLMRTCLFLAGFLAGCASTPKARVVEDVGTVIAAGAAADALGRGDPVTTIAGAGAGLAVKRAIDLKRDETEDRRIREAFELGQLQATKSLHAAIQRTQDADRNDGKGDASLVPLSVPERRVDGVIVNGGVEYVRLPR